MARSYGQGDLLRLTGIARDKVVWWTNQSGLIRASLGEANGVGSSRRFSFQDLVRVAIAGALADQGVSTSTMRRLFSTLDQRGTRPQTFGIAASTGDQQVVRTFDPADAADVLQAVGPAGVVVNIKEIVERLEALTGDKW